MKRVYSFLSTLVCALVLVGCGVQSSNEIEALSNMEPVGSAFTRYLSQEYRGYAWHEHYVAYDYADGLHFARKGIAAAHGEIVMPETLNDWDLAENHLIEMSQARALLVDVLESGGRDLAPQKSAMAQARFDCWVEQQEENWQATEVAGCKNEFFALLRELQALVQPAPVEPPTPAPVPQVDTTPAHVPLEQAMFIVFFDWDKSVLSSGANDVLDAVVAEVMSRDDVATIVVTGHTDSSGPQKYNDKLSKKRAQAVMDGLVARGLTADNVRVTARGENDLLVQTADGVREPANRRAEITLE